MGLATGDRLGPYEISGQLGRGGMGEVYRARDTRLGRDVAIKVLPDSFAKSPERISRFEREARTLAALNHPNVAAIHGLEESGGTSALVLELVEGWTPDGRIVASIQSATTTGFDIGIVSASGERIEPFLSTPANEDSFTISPDGRWIAYESDSTGQYEVYVERFPEGGDRRAISAPDGGQDPLWSRTGTELFYRRLRGKVATIAVPISSSPTFSAGSPKMLFEGDYFETGGRQYDVDREARRLLMFKNPAAGAGPPPRLILVQNFFEELKRLAPTK
jgi:hypothetical protein